MNEASQSIVDPRSRVKLTDFDIARFWSKVDKNGPILVESLGPCWEWKAGRYPAGYGQISIQSPRRGFGAHVISFYINNGYWPAPNCLHKCDNPPCCNPAHLFAGTAKDNVHDMVSKGRIARGDKHGLRIHPERQARGNVHGKAIMTEEKVLALRAMNGTKKHRELAAIFGISRPTVFQIISRRTWTHI